LRSSIGTRASATLPVENDTAAHSERAPRRTLGAFIAALAGLCALSLNFGTARAATIDYIGTGAGTLNGVAFSGLFDVNIIGNTSTISSSGDFFSNKGTAIFVSSAGLATFSSGPGVTWEVILINGPTVSAANVSFAQTQPAPVFAVMRRFLTRPSRIMT
jgi:hypothetical protein